MIHNQKFQIIRHQFRSYDDKNGGYSSIILPDGKLMFSFPIPVRHEKEKGDLSSSIFCIDKKLSDIFLELGHDPDKVERLHHVDPDIQKIGILKSQGASGQLGSASSHLIGNNIGKGDTFLFFGTFCETYYENGTLKYQMMHPFHALWGYLIVDRAITDIESIPNEYRELVNHPHYKNRDIGHTKKILFM